MGKLLAVLLLSSPLLAQMQPPIRPTCTPFFSWDACQSQWNQYQQAVAQYNQIATQQRINAWAQQQQQNAAQALAQQRENAAQATEDAVTPLQDRIIELDQKIKQQNQEIKSLLDRTEQLNEQGIADATAANAAKRSALREGILYGFLGTLILLGLGYGVRRFSSALIPLSRFRLRIVRTTE
jgi:hypothetical protein